MANLLVQELHNALRLLECGLQFGQAGSMESELRSKKKEIQAQLLELEIDEVESRLQAARDNLQQKQNTQNDLEVQFLKWESEQLEWGKTKAINLFKQIEAEMLAHHWDKLPDLILSVSRLSEVGEQANQLRSTLEAEFSLRNSVKDLWALYWIDQALFSLDQKTSAERIQKIENLKKSLQEEAQEYAALIRETEENQIKSDFLQHEITRVADYARQVEDLEILKNVTSTEVDALVRKKELLNQEISGQLEKKATLETNISILVNKQNDLKNSIDELVRPTSQPTIVATGADSGKGKQSVSDDEIVPQESVTNQGFSKEIIGDDLPEQTTIDKNAFKTEIETVKLEVSELRNSQPSAPSVVEKKPQEKIKYAVKWGDVAKNTISGHHVEGKISLVPELLYLPKIGKTHTLFDLPPILFEPTNKDEKIPESYANINGFKIKNSPEEYLRGEIYRLPDRRILFLPHFVGPPLRPRVYQIETPWGSSTEKFQIISAQFSFDEPVYKPKLSLLAQDSSEFLSIPKNIEILGYFFDITEKCFLRVRSKTSCRLGWLNLDDLMKQSSDLNLETLKQQGVQEIEKPMPELDYMQLFSEDFIKWRF